MELLLLLVLLHINIYIYPIQLYLVVYTIWDQLIQLYIRYFTNIHTNYMEVSKKFSSLGCPNASATFMASDVRRMDLRMASRRAELNGRRGNSWDQWKLNGISWDSMGFYGIWWWAGSCGLLYGYIDSLMLIFWKYVEYHV